MEFDLPFDPMERSTEIESLVMEDGKRLYYRFRASRYYGGIVTADAVGCNFLCAYCWNYFRNLNPGRFKNFYTPQQVASRLLDIARKKSLSLFRISGAEPILGERSLEHLVEVLRLIFQNRPGSRFILETNGLMLGYRPEYIQKLKFQGLNVRICLKGTDANGFERITGVAEKYFSCPLITLQECEKLRIKTWPALMGNLFSDREIDSLEHKLRSQGIKARLEIEYLETYPFVVENMEKRKVHIPERSA